MALSSVRADPADHNPASAPNILNLKLNSVTPFLSHRDAVNDRLADAHAILLVMSAAYQDAQEGIGDECPRESIATVSPGLIAKALDAVSNTIAYAQYHLDAASKERRS